MSTRPLQRCLLAVLMGSLSCLAQTLPSCVHLGYAGKPYSIGFPTQPCPHSAFPPLPSKLFESLSSWTSNTSHYKVMSPLDEFKVMARLASSDTSHDHGFAFGPCAIGPWSTYGWAEHADFAYLGVKEAFPNAQSLLTHFEDQAIKFGLAKRDPTFGISFKRSKLTSTKKKHLIQLLVEVEGEVAKIPGASDPQTPLARHLEDNPRHKDNLTKFEIIH